uniref:Head-tail adaptor protein n=1 Tax=OCS116 cluster bacterium TaxID=2030921 RepID=A0A2A4Z914_9PROT
MRRFNIDFGELNQRFSIYSLTIGRDVIGGEIVSKSLWVECWAKLEPQRHSQNLAGQVNRVKDSLIVYMRHQAGIYRQMLIEHEGAQYEIKSVVNMQAADQWLKITASKCEVLI